MELLVVAILIGLIPASIARSKGRDFILWWVYGSLLFIVALPHALIMAKDQKAIDHQELSTAGTRKCPMCAEIIRSEAKKCRFCGEYLLAEEVVAAGEPEPVVETQPEPLIQEAMVSQPPEEKRTRWPLVVGMGVFACGLIVGLRGLQLSQQATNLASFREGEEMRSTGQVVAVAPSFLEKPPNIVDVRSAGVTMRCYTDVSPAMGLTVAISGTVRSPSVGWIAVRPCKLQVHRGRK